MNKQYGFLLIGFFGKNYMPYIQFYEEILNNEGVTYDEVFFDRTFDGLIDKMKTDNGNEYSFHKVTSANNLSKIIPTFRYLYFVKKLIKKIDTIN